MKLHPILRRHGSDLPLLESARMSGRPRSWPGEKLERLLTPSEIEQIERGRL